MGNVLNLKGNVVVADKFVGDIEGELDGDVSADDVTVAAGDDGLGAGDLQSVLQALATRIQVLEDAQSNG